MLNRKIRALLLADTVWFFGEGMLGPLFAVFAQRVGGSVLNIASAWAAYLIVAGVFTILVGKLSDTRIGKKRLVFLGYVLNAVFTFGYLLVDGPAKLLLVEVGLGIAAALATPTWNALFSEYENRKKDGLTWGLADGASQLFTGIAIILGGLVVVYFSFQSLFLIMGIIQVVSVVLLVPILKK
jgi:predicted MFS family arabinose efflux permease